MGEKKKVKWMMMNWNWNWKESVLINNDWMKKENRSTFQNPNDEKKLYDAQNIPPPLASSEEKKKKKRLCQ